MVMTEPAGATRSSTSGGVRVAWGTLGAFLLAWDIFEVAKHQGWVIPAALVGAALPLLPRLAGLGRAGRPGRLPAGLVPAHNLLNRAPIPFAVMVVFSFLGDRPEDIAAPFTFGMSWLTAIALGRAAGFGLCTREGWQR
ncbi:hypothetical protein [Streptomyces yaizuensis]|uniref:DUF4260 family protein n=1 Tax=Streptomyces yaizuensis TaxID=2989713 RepID=A0ABQ5NZ54_9ACTN|nr:hypothetical protein [Streptomyces sp. YSPA8]GLF95636.1 DUF4260 family protein [Streptomyces sp. YSPA8]